MLWNLGLFLQVNSYENLRCENYRSRKSSAAQKSITYTETYYNQLAQAVFYYVLSHNVASKLLNCFVLVNSILKTK